VSGDARNEAQSDVTAHAIDGNRETREGWLQGADTMDWVQEGLSAGRREWTWTFITRAVAGQRAGAVKWQQNPASRSCPLLGTIGTRKACAMGVPFLACHRPSKGLLSAGQCRVRPPEQGRHGTQGSENFDCLE
jgi:hypothetical protein